MEIRGEINFSSFLFFIGGKRNMRRKIGNTESGTGTVIEGTTGAGVALKQYVDGERTGKVTFNHEEIQELIEILEEFK